MQVQRVQQRQQQSERQWKKVIEAACQGAAAGVEATKDMVPKLVKLQYLQRKQQVLQIREQLQGNVHDPGSETWNLRLIKSFF